jgi:hypothetical protein
MSDAARVARATALAHVLDAAFRIPGTRIRFGLDALIGFIPGIGDAIGLVVGGYVVWTAWRIGAPPVVVGRMLGNAGLDALVGAVPLLGDLFDVAFRAHQRNARLLEAYAAAPERTTSRERRKLWVLVAALIVLVLVMLASLLLGLWALARLLAAVASGAPA